MTDSVIASGRGEGSFGKETRGVGSVGREMLVEIQPGNAAMGILG